MVVFADRRVFALTSITLIIGLDRTDELLHFAPFQISSAKDANQTKNVGCRQQRWNGITIAFHPLTLVNTSTLHKPSASFPYPITFSNLFSLHPSLQREFSCFTLLFIPTSGIRGIRINLFRRPACFVVLTTTNIAFQMYWLLFANP